MRRETRGIRGTCTIGALVVWLGLAAWWSASPAAAAVPSAVSWDDHVTVTIGPNLHSLTALDAQDLESTIVDWGATAVFNTQVIEPPSIPALPAEPVHLAVNPPAGVGPHCSNNLAVGPSTRPLTAISATADGSCTATPLAATTVDGTSLEAGTGVLANFIAQYVSTVNIDGLSDVTFHVRSNGPWALSIGHQAGTTEPDPTRVSGPIEGRPRVPGASPLLGARRAAGATSRVDAVVVHFPGPGAYFLELDVADAPGGDQAVVLDSGAATTTADTFSSALRGPSDISNDVGHVATNVAVAGGLGLLVFFPSELFDSTLDEHYDEITGWWRRRRERRRTDGRRRLLLFAGVMLIAAALYCLLDPAAGFNRNTGVLFVGMLVGLLVVTLGFALPSAMFMRLRHHEWGSVYALPAGIIVAAGCVGLSRLVGFQPGYVYGIVAGLAFGAELSAPEEGKAVAVGTAWALVLSALAWVAHGALATRAGAPGAAVGVQIADAAMSVIFVAGLEGAVIGLLPLRTLGGGKVRAWSAPTWLALFAVSLFGFVHVLLNPNSGYVPRGDRPSIVSAALVAAGFAAVSVGFWAWFKVKDRRAA